MTYSVKLFWDSEADVWIATSDDVPGLVLESGSIAALMEKARYAVPELLDIINDDNVIPIHFMAEKYVEAYV